MNTDLKKVLVIDPVVDIEESYMASEAVFKAGVNKSIFVYNADSASDQNFIFNNITPPSLTTVIKRDLRIQYSFAVGVIWTTATGGPNFNAIDVNGAPTGFNGIANSSPSFGVVPRSCPLQSASSAVEVRLNGSSTSTSINDYACIYPHILDNETMARYSSEMPLQKDNNALYYDPNLYYPGNVQNVGTPIVGDALLTVFTPGYTDNRSPFVPYGTNTTVPSRGSYVWTQVVAPAQIGGTAFSSAVYRLQAVETLFISPMVYGSMIDKSAGLANINNLILNVRFQDVNRLVSAWLPAGCTLNITTQATLVWNSLPAGAVAPANANTGNITPSLLIEYITQDPVLSAKMPQTLAYDYSLIQPFISSAGTWVNTTPTVANFPTQSVRLASIPSRLFLFARPSKSALNGATAQTTPDTFLRIKNLQLSFNNRINLFATFTESDLYNMSVKNGLQDSLHDWQYNTGSVLIIDVSKDIGLDSDETTGQANKYSTLMVQATLDASPLAWNSQTNALAYDFYILVEQPGKTFITPSECQYILTGASSAEVLQLTSSLTEKIDHTDLEGKGVGGGVLSTVGNLFKSGVQRFKQINPANVSMGVQSVQNLLKSVGLGVAGGGVAGGGVAGGSMKGKHSRIY